MVVSLNLKMLRASAMIALLYVSPLVTLLHPSEVEESTTLSVNNGEYTSCRGHSHSLLTMVCTMQQLSATGM